MPSWTGENDCELRPRLVKYLVEGLFSNPIVFYIYRRSRPSASWLDPETAHGPPYKRELDCE